MAAKLELDTFIHIRGERGMDMEGIPLGRVMNVAGEIRDIGDEDYRLAAHSFADAKRREFRKLGMSAVVEVVPINGMTPEEIQQKQADIIASDVNQERTQLTTADVLDLSATRIW